MVVLAFKLLVVVLIFYLPAVRVLKKNRNYSVVFASVLIAVGIVVLDILFKCGLSPGSEACVWSKAFFPLTTGIAVFLGTPAFYLLLTGSISVWKKYQNSG